MSNSGQTADFGGDFFDDESGTASQIENIWSDALSSAGGSLPGDTLHPPKEADLPAPPAPSCTASLSVKPKTIRSPEAPPQPGADFELLEQLGQGGMGVVYTAHQTSVDRTVAMKMIRPHLAENPQQREKFLIEAAVTGDLDHPNIVPVYDLGKSDDGALYYAMKCVQGSPWDEAIETNSLDQNLDILMDVANAVAFAHARGIIHRDLKPQNVMLGHYGEVLVMDWGLAAGVTPEAKADRLSRRNAAGGTPAYMAPEMALAKIDKIGTASDIYLLGAILFEIVTGERPHQGDQVIVVLVNAGLNEIVRTDVSGELFDIAMQAMAEEPEDRFPTVQAFQDAIRSYRSHMESIALARNAEDDLCRGIDRRDYECYNKALFGFRAALERWPDNRIAADAIPRAQLFYAQCAFEKEDYDLALGQLEKDRRTHKELYKKIVAARSQREARLRRMRGLRRLAVGLGAAMLLILSTASFLIYRQMERALKAEGLAQEEKDKAVAAKDAETKQRQLAEAAQTQALKARDVAAAQREQAETARGQAEAARLAEAEQRKVAEAMREKALAQEKRAVQALTELMEAQTREEAAEAKAKAARVMAQKAQAELSRTGMLLDNSWWIFDRAAALDRQKKAAKQIGQPVERTIPLPGDTLLPFVLIPGGAFVMGSPPEEQKRAGVEYLHRVDLSRPYYMGQYEVTRRQWAAVLGKGSVEDGSLPKTEITLKEIEEQFLPALNKYAPAGHRLRLPTEAEWEYACRSGTATPYNTGPDDADLAGAGWYLFNSERKLQPAGRRKPNAWGVYDMHGNASEWCLDAYDPGFYLQKEATDPLRTPKAKDLRRVIRGGSYLNLAQHCRSAYRSWAHRKNRYKFLGFRVVLTAPPKP